jgi:tetratricopeptide (TPR) repeat protein
MKKLLLSSIVALSLIGNSLYALEANATSKSVSANAIKVAKKSANKQKDDTKIIKEAVESIDLVAQTIKLIDQKKKDDAIKTLEKAIGKIEVVLSNPKAPALIPVDAKVIVAQYLGDAYSAQNAVITSVALLQSQRVQEARRIVSALIDEIDFKTINLPLASYPSALKMAAKNLHDNKLDEAKKVLVTTLNTFVSITTITPIGILEAQDLIIAASKVAKENKELALSHLSAAKEALKRSEALGYTSYSDTTYKMLNEEIRKVEKEIKGKNKAEKLFENLIEKIKEFKEKALKTFKK